MSINRLSLLRSLGESRKEFDLRPKVQSILSLDNGLKFKRKQRVWAKMDSKVQRGLKRSRLKGKSTSSTSDWSRLGSQDTRQVFEANPSMLLWTIGWSFKGKQNGLGSKIQRIKGGKGKSTCSTSGRSRLPRYRGISGQGPGHISQL